MKILKAKIDEVGCMVDDHVYDYFQKNGHKIYKGYGRSRQYYGICIRNMKGLLHRMLYEVTYGPIPWGKEIDHIDQNPRNNQVANLRAVTRSVNHASRGLQNNNTSGFKGVKWYKPYGKWMVSFKKEGEFIFVGYFSDKIQAARKMNEAFTREFPEAPIPNQI